MEEKFWKTLKKCENVWKIAKKCEKSAETILPFSCCPLVFLWLVLISRCSSPLGLQRNMGPNFTCPHLRWPTATVSLSRYTLSHYVFQDLDREKKTYTGTRPSPFSKKAMQWGKKWPVPMNLPFFGVEAYVPGGGPESGRKSIQKMPSGRYRYQNDTFPGLGGVSQDNRATPPSKGPVEPTLKSFQLLKGVSHFKLPLRRCRGTGGVSQLHCRLSSCNGALRPKLKIPF